MRKKKTIGSENVVNKPKRGGKPFRRPSEFVGLTAERLERVHEIIRRKTYEEAQEELREMLGCKISTSRLRRYREKIDLAEALEILAKDTVPAVDRLNDLLAGREVDIDPAGMLVIKDRALRLAASPKTSPTLLKDLFRIFAYEDRRKDNAHRREMAERREATRKEAVDDRKVMNEHRRGVDARRLELADQRERTRARLVDAAEREQEARGDFARHRKEIATKRLELDTRKQKHREEVRRPTQAFDQDEMTKEINALLAAGAEFARQAAAAREARKGLVTSTSTEPGNQMNNETGK